MKIRSIILENNPIFGNQRIELDFTKSDWTIFDNIIFVWENGSWKSTMLEDIIFQFSNLGVISNWNTWEKRRFQVELTKKEKEIIELTNAQFKWIEDILIFSYDLSITDNWQQLILNDSNSKTISSSVFCSNQKVKKIFKSIYSSAEINFTGDMPTTSSNKDIDVELKSSIKSPTNLANDITQLIVDISKQDGTDDSNYMESEVKAWRFPNLELIKKRTSRFRNAFEKLFGTKLTFEWVSWTIPNFKKWNNIFDINRLSSWEKQIVFRGWFLLKDQNSLLWSPVLIDEPEISLHPSRQLKILDFYKAIFTDTSTHQQTSQLFITSHSPYIFKTAKLTDYKLFIFRRNDTTQNVEVISSDKLWWLYWSPTWWEINWYAYWLPTLEFHDELYWFLHDKFITSGINDKAKAANASIDDFDNYIQSTIPSIITKQWDKEIYWSSWFNTKPQIVSISTFIRHKSHHPENRTMQPVDFTLNELEQSIKDMISMI